MWNVTKDEDEVLAREADARVQEALEHVEAAQRELMYAAELLANVMGLGACETYQRVSKMRDRVHDMWRRVAYGFRDVRRGKLSLDEFAAPDVLRRHREGQERSSLDERFGGVTK